MNRYTATESIAHVATWARARYMRFQRNDSNVVMMPIAEDVLAKNSTFALFILFVVGGRFLQE